MVLVRERRHQEALKLPLPPPNPELEFHQRNPFPLPLPSGPDSPGVENLADLEKLEVIGHGNGGTVYKVRHRRNSAIYALKVIKFELDSIEIRQQAILEAEIFERVDSQFIVKCHGVFVSGGSDSENGGDLYFMMEYMEAGSLHDILMVHHRLSEESISGVARRVLEGLKYLHSIHIVHRDIKPSNLLINGRGEVKIADFGVSRFVVETLDVHDSYVGTCAYMSPERFDPDKWIMDQYNGFAGDVWALGVVLLECHLGYFPLISPSQKPDWASLMYAICFGEPPLMLENLSPEFQSFVHRCLEKDWKKRGTVSELLNHPFVFKYNSPASSC